MLLYRILHEKLSTRSNLHRIIHANIEGKYYQLCKLPEIEQHMLFNCIQRQDSWEAAFKKYLSNPKILTAAQYSWIYLHLDYKDYTLHYHDKFKYMPFCYSHPIHMESPLAVIL